MKPWEPLPRYMADLHVWHTQGSKQPDDGSVVSTGFITHKQITEFVLFLTYIC